MIGTMIVMISIIGQQVVVPTKVKDGDTFICDVDLGWRNMWEHGVDVRVMGFDAWENSYHRKTVNITPQEIVKGNLAKIALEKVFRTAKLVQVIQPKDKDTYGRTLLWVYVDGKELGALMRGMGHERDKDKEETP
jgi:endonuclease YncB( thermonuclease family)